jgi:hypothetical protein
MGVDNVEALLAKKDGKRRQRSQVCQGTNTTAHGHCVRGQSFIPHLGQPRAWAAHGRYLVSPALKMMQAIPKQESDGHPDCGDVGYSHRNAIATSASLSGFAHPNFRKNSVSLMASVERA